MRRWSLFAAIAALMAPLASALAQDLPQHLEAKTLTADGKLVGCSLEFTIAFRDHVYRRGAATGVTGSINLWRKNNAFGGSFKLVGADIDTGDAIIFPVTSAHLFNSGSGPHEAAQFQCEDPRHYCAAVGGEAFLEVLADASADGVIRMAFNRKRGGMDVPVELNVKPQVALDALQCAENLGR